MTLIDIIDCFSQGIIICTGTISLYFMASQNPKTRMYAALIGLSGEPLWLTTAIINQQYGIMVLCFVYGINWARCAYLNWKVLNP